MWTLQAVSYKTALQQNVRHYVGESGIQNVSTGITDTF
jgi:hypothetical protein